MANYILESCKSDDPIYNQDYWTIATYHSVSSVTRPEEPEEPVGVEQPQAEVEQPQAGEKIEGEE